MQTQREARRRPLQTLVLNADCRPLSSWPLSVVPAQDAVHVLYRERVTVIENWQGPVQAYRRAISPLCDQGNSAHVWTKLPTSVPLMAKLDVLRNVA